MTQDLSRHPPGSLISVTMINFMKHDNLCINLEPHVNFINGRNGSGKSSILVALTIGLGSTTRNVGRGNNFADVIKEDKHEASIIILIRNGEGGYMPEKYGETIQITRKIRRTNTSFEIAGFPKTSAKQIRQELEKILQYFNIQIDNPCSIMQQERAREFIGTSTPEMKYDLFMKGTLLSKLTEEITTIGKNIAQVQNLRESRIEEKGDLDKEFEEIKSLNEIVEEADDLFERIHDLENELVWSHFRQADIAQKEAQKALTEQERKLSEQQDKMLSKEQEKNAAYEEYENFKTQMTAEMAKLNEIKRQKDKLAGELNEVRSKLSSNKGLLERRRSALEKTKRDLKRKTDEKEKLMKKRDNAIEEARRKKEKYIAEREEAQATYTEQLREVENNLAQTNRNVEQIQGDVDHTRSILRDISAQYSSIDGKLRSLQNLYSNQNSNDNFKNKLRSKERNFSFPPIGPISNYIKMKDKKWGLAAQHIIGKSLDTFLVNSIEDERLFRQLLPQQSSRIQVVITGFDQSPYNISQITSPHRNAIQLLDTLKISGDTIKGRVGNRTIEVDPKTIIRNTLIDYHNVERVWCVEDEGLAKDIGFNDEKFTSITPEGVQFKIQAGYNVRLGTKPGTTCKIGVDESYRIEQLTTEKNRLVQEKARAENDNRNAENELRSVKAQRSRYEKERSSLKQNLNRITVELENPPDDAEDFDSKLSTLDTSINNLLKEMEFDEKDIPSLEEEQKRLSEQKKSIIDQIDKLTSQLNQTDTFKTESDRLYNKYRAIEREVEREQKIKSSIKEKVNKLVSKVASAQDEANDTLNKARKHSPECENKYKNTARQPQALATLLMEEKKKYEKAQQNHNLDFAQIRQKYEKIKAEVEKANKFLRELDEFIQHAKNGLENRQNKLQAIQRSITRRAKVSFLNYQRQRKYNGKLNFNHELKKIEIGVKSKADNTFTDVSLLSGGEKSYCLVSLLLSLWEVMECPFYCVDEYDVFLDDINRQAATNLLVKGAETMSHRQFIFITPLSLDTLKNNPHVTVFRLQ